MDQKSKSLLSQNLRSISIFLLFLEHYVNFKKQQTCNFQEKNNIRNPDFRSYIKPSYDGIYTMILI